MLDLPDVSDADRAAAFPIGATATLAELEADPHPLLRRLRGSEPVSWLPMIDGWLVTSHALASTVMRDDATFTVDDPRFTTAQVVGPSMLSLDGLEHARHREPFVGPFLRTAVMTTQVAEVGLVVERLLGAIRDRGSGELRTELAAPLAVASMARMLGLDADPLTALRWYEGIVDDVTALTAGVEPSGCGTAAMVELGEAVGSAARRRGTLVASATPSLAPDEIAANVAVLLFGGIETTEATIATSFVHLLSRADELARVRDDPALTAAAVEESLRLEPAAAVVDRYATRPVELGGVAIAERELVRVSLSGANRDPSVFAEPDLYDLERRDVARHVTFAHGPHVCLGLHVARLEAEAALRGALATLPSLRLDPAQPAAVRGLVFRKPQTVHVLWDT